MDRGAGIVRNEELIAEALSEWDALDREGGGLNEAVADPRLGFRLGTMHVMARLLLESARLRTESRGAHYRSDYPEMDAAWTTHVCFSLT
jgi:succinate dehydrogenase/fumarate reductase flavoprotein subunit